MKYLALIVLAALLATPACAQGVKDPSTPQNRVVIVSPPEQPAPPTAVRNIPPQQPALPLGVQPNYRYYRGVRR
jgi:hypothetical protein